MAATARKRPGETRVLRFLLGDAVQTLTAPDPNMTVLDYLRLVAGRSGTKEGCAEGDCGACTVVLGTRDGARLRYRAVNACILFLPVLDGKQLLTVEDLRAPDGTLHPVQRAMVDHHGAQCGFCTPGFIMSLFALYKAGETDGQRLDRRRIDDAIAGNLCRCTGYRPIADAALAMGGGGDVDHFAAREAETVARLRAIRRRGTLALAGAGRRYFAPRSAAALARLLIAHPDATLLAGGTDVGLWVTKQHRDLDTLIHVGDVTELRTLRQVNGHLEIGAAVTYGDAVAAIARHYPDFAELIRRLGSVQIRNSGTLGGNIANGSPIGDSMPALIALGARLVLRRGARRREMALDEFFLDYRKTALTRGAFIERIRLPIHGAARRFATYKVTKRFDQDISAVCGAFSLALDGRRVRDIRICYGGMAAIPKRARHCERALIGGEWSEASVDAAARALARDYAPITDMRASGDYRMLVAGNLLRKFFMEGEAQAPDLRVLAFAR